jgi:hypothetical protein
MHITPSSGKSHSSRASKEISTENPVVMSVRKMPLYQQSIISTTRLNGPLSEAHCMGRLFGYWVEIFGLAEPAVSKLVAQDA